MSVLGPRFSRDVLCAIAIVLAISMSGCMLTSGKLPQKNSPEFLKVQTVGVAPVGVPEGPSVRILNSGSDWFYVPGVLAEGAYVGYAGTEVAGLLKQAHFDYGNEAARFFEQSVAKSGLSIVRDGAVRSEHRRRSLTKCPKPIEADACLDVRMAYFGYVAAFTSSDYVPTVHISARLIRKRDGLLLFERNIHYNPVDPGRAIDVFASDQFRFHDLDAMRADPEGVVAGLRTALGALALELEAQLRSSLTAPVGE